jgi:hypothetical protein
LGLCTALGQAVLVLLVGHSGQQHPAKWLLLWPGMYWQWNQFQSKRGVNLSEERSITRLDWSSMTIYSMTLGISLCWWMTALWATRWEIKMRSSGDDARKEPYTDTVF